MTLLPLLYTLDESCPVPWSTSAEVQLHSDYPFVDIKEETEQEFVIRRYLETLWLPESLNPLTYFSNSLRRVSHDTTSESGTHPLHAYIEPLLLSARASSEKYRTELNQILIDGGGAGEQEEMMMWYAREYEKATPNEKEKESDEEKWRKVWFERLERREAMIQIVLLMLKLSLPGPKPESIPSSPTKRRKKKRSTNEEEEETEEDRLESYMDKLAVWQLTASMEDLVNPGASSSKGNTKEERHWSQTFCEDVVEPLFKTELPSLCELLRSKIFPDSFFSEDESPIENSEGNTNSNPPKKNPRSKNISRKVSTTLIERSDSISLSTRADSASKRASSLQRSRSRSLSVSLALDEESQRANIIQPKATLSREVSMSLVFKEKSKPTKQIPKEKPKESMKEKQDQPRREKGRNVGMTIVADTPVRRKRGDTAALGASQDTSSTLPALFARATGGGLVAGGRVLSPPQTSSPGEICIGETPIRVNRSSSGRPENLPRLELKVKHEEIDSTVKLDAPLSPLSPLSDPNEGTLLDTPTVCKTKARGRRQSSASLMNDGFKDEEVLIDGFSAESFSDLSSPDVLLLTSPTTRVSRKGGKRLLGTKNKGPRAGLAMNMDVFDLDELDFETPTKKRVKRV